MDSGQQEGRASSDGDRRSVLHCAAGCFGGGVRVMTLTLPWPPSVNHLYAVVNGRKVLSAKGRDYIAEVARSVARQTPCTFGPLRIAYSAVAFPPDRRRRDLSNLVKIVEDSLTKAGVWDDDSQVDQMTWIRSEPVGAGSVFIEIREMGK